jgi:hypothetical protein
MSASFTLCPVSIYGNGLLKSRLNLYYSMEKPVVQARSEIIGFAGKYGQGRNNTIYRG